MSGSTKELRPGVLAPGDWVMSPDGHWARFESARPNGRATTIVLVGGATFTVDEGRTVLVWSGTGPPSGIPTIPDWDEYFLGIAQAVAARGKCRRRQVGSLIVGNDRRIISTGYNGAPSGMADCIDGACPRGMLNYADIEPGMPYDDPTGPGFCTASHAEANALAFTQGRPVDATCYVTSAPCPGCTKALAGAGVSRVAWPGGEGCPIAMLTSRRIFTQRPGPLEREG